MTSTIYTMTESTFKSLRTRGNTKLTCYSCGEPIKVGQDVASAIKAHGRRLRHLSCAKKIGAA